MACWLGGGEGGSEGVTCACEIILLGFGETEEGKYKVHKTSRCGPCIAELGGV